MTARLTEDDLADIALSLPSGPLGPAVKRLLAEVRALTAERDDARVKFPPPSDDDLGREVRRVWESWAREQPDPKTSWTKPWKELSDAERDVDRRIGAWMWNMGRRAGSYATAHRADQEKAALQRERDIAQTTLWVERDALQRRLDAAMRVLFYLAAQ